MVKLIKNNLKAITITIIAFLNVLILLKLDYKCPWRQNLHIYCAGCGGTRMLRAILELDFYQAFRYNSLLFFVLLVLLVYLIYVFVCNLLKIKYRKITQTNLLVLLFITITFMILRNIDIFSYLKPTTIP